MFFDFVSGTANRAQSSLEGLYNNIRDNINRNSQETINLRGLIGAPPTFSEYADVRTSGNPYGQEYINKFIQEGNFVAIEAGQPRLYMKEDDVVEGTVNDGDSETLRSNTMALLNTMQDSPNRQLFGFQTAMDQYWSDVTKLCSMTAYMLDIEDKGRELGFGRNIRNFNWRGYISDYLEEYVNDSWEYIPFYNDGIIDTSESISHTSGPTSIERNINNNFVTNNAVSDAGREIAMLSGWDVDDALREAEKFSDSEGVQGQNLLSRLKNFFTGGMAGLNIKMNLPDIWQDSSYSKDYNLKFKLTTPHGDPLGVWVNIIAPLCHILPLVTARQIGLSNTYMGGYLLRIFSEGMVNLDLGMATNVAIERNQEAVSKDGLPTEIDVTVTITDLFPMLGLPMRDTYGAMAAADGLMGYLGTLCGFNSTYFDVKTATDFKVSWTFTDLIGKYKPSNIAARTRNKIDMGVNRMAQDLIDKHLL